MSRFDFTKYRVAAHHVVSNTASLDTGRMVVALRIDDGASDDVCMTPRQARALARQLVEFASRAAKFDARKAGAK